MKKNTISLSELTYQILFEQRVQRLMENISSAASSANSALKKLSDEVIDAGLDMNDEEVQAALLVKLLDAKGDVSKVDAEDVKELESQIQESRGWIHESGGVAFTVAHHAGEVLGNAAFIGIISHGLAKLMGKKDEEVKAGVVKFSKLLKNIAAVTGFAGKAVEKFFKWIAAKWGAGEKTQKIFGIAGMMLFVIVMGVVAVLAFPHLTSWLAIAMGVTAMAGKVMELVTLVKHLLHVVGEHQHEVEKTDDKTELQKKIDNWLNAPISGPNSDQGDAAKNASMMR